MATDKISKRVSIRWWHWVILGVLLSVGIILATVIFLRQRGTQEYQTYLNDMHANGIPATIEDFISLAPDVDVEAQNNWQIWENSISNHPLLSYSHEWGDYVLGIKDLSQKTHHDLNELKDDLLPAIKLLNEKKLVLSYHGYIKEKYPLLKGPLLESIHTIKNIAPTPQFILADWLKFNACLTNDELERQLYINTLSLFHEASSKPTCLIEAIYLQRLHEDRDDMFLALTLMNKLKPELLYDWLEEPNDIPEWYARALDGERMLSVGSLVDFYDKYTLWPDFDFSGPSSKWTDFVNPQNYYAHAVMYGMGQHDCRNMGYLYFNYAERLRRNSLVSPTDLPDNGWTLMTKLCVQNMKPSQWMISIKGAQHRVVRLGARIIHSARTHGLPINETELVARLNCLDMLRPGGDHLHLKYILLSPNRFRIAIDPTTPIPDFDNANTIAEKAKLFTAPPNKDKYNSYWGRLEIELQPHHLPQATP